MEPIIQNHLGNNLSGNYLLSQEQNQVPARTAEPEILVEKYWMALGGVKVYV